LNSRISGRLEEQNPEKKKALKRVGQAEDENQGLARQERARKKKRRSISALTGLGKTLTRSSIC